MTRRFTQKEKIKAVLRANVTGVTAEEVASKIGIHTFSLYRWKKELRDLGVLVEMPKDTKVQPDADLERKLKALQKENEQLRMENAILKKLKEYGDAKRKKPSN